MNDRETPDDLLDQLPGAALVRQGLDDLARGTVSAEALLVEAAAPRLRRVGLNPAQPASTAAEPSAELRLYRLLCQQSPRDAYSRYNALLRQLTRCERALEHRFWRRARSAGRASER